MPDVKDKLLELAKIEAAQYGEAKAKSVIGKAMGKYPELRSQAKDLMLICLLYTSPRPRAKRQSRMTSSA